MWKKKGTLAKWIQREKINERKEEKEREEEEEEEEEKEKEEEKEEEKMRVLEANSTPLVSTEQKWVITRTICPSRPQQSVLFVEQVALH